MGKPTKQGKRQREPEWHEILNGQMWQLRRTVIRAAWIMTAGFAVLVGLILWRVLR